MTNSVRKKFNSTCVIICTTAIPTLAIYNLFKYFILDEADRMLDMGFFDDIMRIVKCLPQDRQTIMFSATMPSKIRQLARSIMNHPKEIKIAISRPPESITQGCVILYEAQKTDMIEHILKQAYRTEDNDTPQTLKKIIIFAGKKQRVKEITRTLRSRHFNARAMHSDLEQKERDEVMLDFRNEKVDILVATDIVARGIDIDDIPLVINYDVPHNAEDYVHRIGRTARAASLGAAITFVTQEDYRYFNKIETFLKKKIERITVPQSLGEAPTISESSTRSGKGCCNGSRRSSRNQAQRRRK